MNSSTPSSPLSGPTHDPSSDSSNARSLSVYRGLSESTGTQPVKHATSASKTKYRLFMRAILGLLRRRSYMKRSTPKSERDWRNGHALLDMQANARQARDSGRKRAENQGRPSYRVGIRSI